jgi:hypothetical protein
MPTSDKSFMGHSNSQLFALKVNDWLRLRFVGARCCKWAQSSLQKRFDPFRRKEEGELFQ